MSGGKEATSLLAGKDQGGPPMILSSSPSPGIDVVDDPVFAHAATTHSAKNVTHRAKTLKRKWQTRFITLNLSRLSQFTKEVAISMALIDETADPFALFTQWFSEAEDSEINDPNAVTVSTVDEEGLPDARTLLLKGRTDDGFVFYTNLTSEKGRQLLATRKCALLFHWKTLRRQIRMRGPVALVSDEMADAYFATRRRMSQIGAWASDQSSPLDSRETFESRIASFEAKFEGQDVPRPPHWSGFCLTPIAMEFWQDRDYRLHDRVRYTKTKQNTWPGQRLYP